MSARRERGELRERLSAWAEAPLAGLALLSLLLLVIEFSLSPAPPWSVHIERTQIAIWVLFAVVFVIELALAPSKREYLRHNWLSGLAVLLPAIRAVRLLRVARSLRGVGLLRALGAVNRGTRALERILRRGRFGYVAAVTIIVTVTGAAAVLYFDRGVADARITTFGDALWWAATVVTTVNSDLEAASAEARIVAVLLRIFGLGVAGYVTAVIAVHLLGLGEASASHPPARETRVPRALGARHLRRRRRPRRPWVGRP